MIQKIFYLLGISCKENSKISLFLFRKLNLIKGLITFLEFGIELITLIVENNEEIIKKIIFDEPYCEFENIIFFLNRYFNIF